MLALKFECEIVRQMSAFMIAAKQPQSIWIPNFQGPQVEHTLDAEVPSIDVVAKKKISCLSRISTDFKQLHEIIVLAMNITTDRDWRVHLKEVRFLSQDPG